MPGPKSQDSWQAILSEVRKTLSPQQFSTWFHAIRPRTVSARTLEIVVPNSWTRDWLTRYYLATIRAAAAKVLKGSPEVAFEIDSEPAPAMERPRSVPREALAAAAAANAPAAPASDENSVPLNDEHTFDNFVVGQTNRLAHAAAQAVADAPSQTFNPLFLYGDVGLGKTHLLQAICHQIRRRRPDLRLRYISCETFINDFISALQTKTLERFRERYRKSDVLLVDDIHYLSGKSSTQEEFYHTFNALFSDKKQIILSSDGPPEGIGTVEQRLLSRLKWGMVAPIGKPDYETRILVLKKKAQQHGVAIPDEVAAFLATHLDTNIRELEGAVVNLKGHAFLTKRPVGLDLAREVFQKHLREDASPVSLQEIQTAVTDHFRVKLSDLQSRKRNKAVAVPRQVCMYLARRLTENSLEEIGRYFGGRDHSTVIYACEQVQERIGEDAQLKGLIETFTTRLKRRAV